MDNIDKINHVDKKGKGKVSTTGELPQVVTIPSLFPNSTATSSNVTEPWENKAGKEVKEDRDQSCLDVNSEKMKHEDEKETLQPLVAAGSIISRMSANLIEEIKESEHGEKSDKKMFENKSKKWILRPEVKENDQIEHSDMRFSIDKNYNLNEDNQNTSRFHNNKKGKKQDKRKRWG